MTLPPDFGTIPFMPVESLDTAQTVVRVFDIVVIGLVALALVLAVLAIWLAGNRRRMVIYVALGTIVTFLLVRLFTRAASDAMTASISEEGLRGAVRSILDATLSDFRGWALIIVLVLGIIAIVVYAFGRPMVSRASFSSERSRERIGLALVALVVLWIAVGLEVALLAAVLIIGLELVLRRDQGDSGEANPPSTSMPYTPIPPPTPPSSG